jgi:hypothetical protein
MEGLYMKKLLGLGSSSIGFSMGNPLVNYRKGIFKLLERWEICVQRDGDYVENKQMLID